MAEFNPGELVIRPISETDSVNSLSMGEQEFTPLKAFLRGSAKRFHAASIARTYVLAQEEHPNRVYGYLTLVASEVGLEGAYVINDCNEANGYTDLPAVKIARLAVDRRLRGLGYGPMFVDLAIDIARTQIVPWIGCRFMIVDSKKSSIGFYERHGFRLIDTPANCDQQHPTMFLDLHKL
ncbi:MAG: GNAT family N-acetyltransferase [Pseudomonadota bacterium]